MTFKDVFLKRHDFVTSNDVIKHILPYISATEPLINYCIFLKPYIFLFFKDMHLVYP